MKNTVLATLLLLSLLSACKKNATMPPKQTATDTLSLQAVSAWYQGQADGTRRQSQAVNSPNPPPIDFSRAQRIRLARGNWWIAALGGQPVYRHVAQGYRRIVFYRDSSRQIRAHILDIIPDALYFQQAGTASTATFTGRVFIRDLQGTLLRGLVYRAGKAIGRIRPKTGNGTTRQTDEIAIIQSCAWYDDNYLDSDNHVVVYSEYDCDNTIIDGGAGAIGDGGAVTGGDYLGSGSAGGSTAPPPTADLPNANDPKVDPKAYMNCFGSIPDAGAKTTVTIYVQEPWPGTSFNVGPNSVGHTAIALTKTNGTTTITQVVGFYPDATGLAKFSAPSKVLDNGGDLAYDVSISYEVLPSQFDHIVNYIANPPATYNLLTFNCTNFVYAACQTGGITLPDRYSPVGLDAAEVMTPAALGNQIENLKGEPNVNVNGGTAPNSHGPCN